MPYIKQEDRVEAELYPCSPGELNFAITKIVVRYLDDHPRYHNYAEAVAALECAKLELYRRMVAPYENKKCLENGDVYPSTE